MVAHCLAVPLHLPQAQFECELLYELGGFRGGSTGAAEYKWSEQSLFHLQYAVLVHIVLVEGFVMAIHGARLHLPISASESIDYLCIKECATKRNP